MHACAYVRRRFCEAAKETFKTSLIKHKYRRLYVTIKTRHIAATTFSVDRNLSPLRTMR